MATDTSGKISGTPTGPVTPFKIPPATPPGTTAPSKTGHSGDFADAPTPTSPNADPITPLTAAQNGALSYLKNTLDQYGLGDLTNWAADELRKGYDDTVVLQHLREQPAFQQRFKVIFDRQDAGLPAISPAQVIEYERTATQLMTRFGVPAGFYDKSSDFHDLLMKDVSATELQSRLESGYSKVLTAPQEVKDVFRDFFGAGSTQALAAFFLDPDKAQPVLEQQLQAGLTAGAGRRYGFNLSEDTANRLASVGIDENQAAKGFLQMNTQKGLYDENFGEKDIDANTTGVAATFGLDAEAQRVLDRRSEERSAAFAGQGSALQTKDGVRGAGVADQ